MLSHCAAGQGTQHFCHGVNNLGISGNVRLRNHIGGVVQFKDLALGKVLAAGITSNKEWKAQPAKMEIKRADLVVEVRKMISQAG